MLNDGYYLFMIRVHGYSLVNRHAYECRLSGMRDRDSDRGRERRNRGETDKYGQVNRYYDLSYDLYQDWQTRR